MNVDLEAKLVDDLKCENESLKMHAKCLIIKPIATKEENLCCNHVVLPDFVPIVSLPLKTNQCIFLHTKETK